MAILFPLTNGNPLPSHQWLSPSLSPMAIPFPLTNGNRLRLCGGELNTRDDLKACFHCCLLAENLPGRRIHTVARHTQKHGRYALNIKATPLATTQALKAIHSVLGVPAEEACTAMR